MRAMPGLTLLSLAALLAIDAAALPAMSHASLARPAAATVACPHLDQLLEVVRHNSHQLMATRISSGKIAKLFDNLPVDLPSRLARADTALIIRAANGRGRAIIVLFANGCVLAALRLPAAAAALAIRTVLGQEI